MMRRPSGLLIPDQHGRLHVARLDLFAGRFTAYGREWARDRRSWLITPRGMLLPQIAGGSGFSQYAESHIVDHANGKTSWTMPTGSYLCLCTSVPTSTNTGSTITEASYTGYGRQSLSGKWAAATAATPSVGATNATVTFAACTGGSSTVTAIAICDASTAGNMIWWGTCSSTTVSTTYTPATVASGALTVQLT